jgi:hypothetical protein
MRLAPWSSARAGLALWLLLAARLGASDERAAGAAGAPVPAGTEAPAGAGPEAKAPGPEVEKLFQFDGQLRFRFEYLDPFAYTAAGVDQSDDYVLMRTRFGVLVTPHRRIAARLQLQDSRIWGEEGADTPTSPSSSVTSSTDNLDLHLAYVDINNVCENWLDDALLLRVGRQELSYGDQRLVSPLDWSNIARAWDAAKLTIAPAAAPAGLTVDVFASIIRDTTSSDAGGGPVGVSTTDQQQGFHGLYASFEEIRPAGDWTWTDGAGKERPVIARHILDLYAFYRDLSDGVFTAEDGTTGDVDEVTLGTRLAGGALQDDAGGGFDYTAEGAYQTGDYVGDSILAYGYALTAGYTFAAAAPAGSKLRLGVEYDHGSGDRDPTDGRHETFDPLFPFGHAYQGIQDTFSWKNGQDLAFKVDLYPPKSTGIPHAEIQYHAFWLSGRKDAWFNAGLAEIRRDPTGSSGRFVGHEIDVTFKYAIVPAIAVVWIGYSHFFPGEFVRQTGESPDRDFVFTQLVVNF